MWIEKLWVRTGWQVARNSLYRTLLCHQKPWLANRSSAFKWVIFKVVKSWCQITYLDWMLWKQWQPMSLGFPKTARMICHEAMLLTMRLHNSLQALAFQKFLLGVSFIISLASSVVISLISLFPPPFNFADQEYYLPQCEGCYRLSSTSSWWARMNFSSQIEINGGIQDWHAVCIFLLYLILALFLENADLIRICSALFPLCFSLFGYMNVFSWLFIIVDLIWQSEPEVVDSFRSQYVFLLLPLFKNALLLLLFTLKRTRAPTQNSYFSHYVVSKIQECMWNYYPIFPLVNVMQVYLCTCIYAPTSFLFWQGLLDFVVFWFLVVVER